MALAILLVKFGDWIPGIQAWINVTFAGPFLPFAQAMSLLFTAGALWIGSSILMIGNNIYYDRKLLAIPAVASCYSLHHQSSLFFNAQPEGMMAEGKLWVHFFMSMVAGVCLVISVSLLFQDERLAFFQNVTEQSIHYTKSMLKTHKR